MLDCDGIVLPVDTTSLLDVFGDHVQSQLVIQDTNNPHLSDAPNTVWLCVWGGYRLLVVWSLIQREIFLQRVRARTRLDVIPSSNVNVCATSKAAASLELVVEALTEARINTIYLVQFGMKRPLTEMHFLERGTICSTDNTRWDVGFDVRSNSVVALTSSVPLVLVNGMFLEDGQGGGSLKIETDIDGVPVTIKAYPLVMHMVKALLPKEALMPKSILSAQKKINLIEAYVTEIQQRREQCEEQMYGYRVEMCIYRLCTIVAVIQVAIRVYTKMRANEYSIQMTATLTLDDYMALIRREINNCRAVMRGRSRRSLNGDQQEAMARLYNAVGYHSGRWYRRINLYPRPPASMTDETTMDPALALELVEAARCLYTRPTARNKLLICAVRKNGSCTRAFKTVEELARYVLIEFEGDWRTELKLQAEPAPLVSAV